MTVFEVFFPQNHDTDFSPDCHSLGTLSVIMLQRDGSSFMANGFLCLSMIDLIFSIDSTCFFCFDGIS